MGRIKTAKIKRSANSVLKLHSDKLTTDFIENKRLVREFAEVPSKKIRNIVAGYLVRLKKMQIIEEKILRGELPERKPKIKTESSDTRRRPRMRRGDQERR